MSRIRELREQLNLSQDQLANLAEVSRHAVIRNEQLCYPNPLPRVVTALSELTGLAPLSIETDYYQDVLTNRRTTGALLKEHHNYLLALTHQLVVNSGLSGTLSSQHPFAFWRLSVSSLLNVSSSQIHFSIMTSIHPATLFKYESFKTGFPAPMHVALTQLGLPDEQLALFAETSIFNWIRR